MMNTLIVLIFVSLTCFGFQTAEKGATEVASKENNAHIGLQNIEGTYLFDECSLRLDIY